MPVSPRSKANSTTKNEDKLLIPQARVLAALQPARPNDDPIDWPLLTRARLGVRAGYTAISGTVTRALNGIREGSSSGTPHPGLLARGLVDIVQLDIDGVMEDNYQVSPAGIAAFQAFIAAGGVIPKVKDAVSCTNTSRGYKVGQNEQGATKRY